jgi:hypothetical protein
VGVLAWRQSSVHFPKGTECIENISGCTVELREMHSWFDALRTRPCWHRALREAAERPGSDGNAQPILR